MTISSHTAESVGLLVRNIWILRHFHLPMKWEKNKSNRYLFIIDHD